MTIPTLAIARGDTLAATLTVTDRATGIATSIAGWTPRWTCKRSTADLDAAAVLTATVGAGLTVLDAAAGTIALLIAASVTATLDPTVYVWDLQLTSGTTVRTAMSGSLTITADVTRTTP